MSGRVHAEAKAASKSSFTPVRTGLLQRSSANHAGPATAPPIVQEVLRSPGQPLDAATRAHMEPRFGHDFGQVRVHTDVRAVESARRVNALAYTVGQSIVFGTGSYAPETAQGKKILAHELAHTVQQGDQSSLPHQLKIGHLDDKYEGVADHVGSHILDGISFKANRYPKHEASLHGVIQRRVIHGGDILYEGTCEHLACDSKWACCNPQSDIHCPGKTSSDASNTCPDERWTALFTCDSTCENAIANGCDDADNWMAIPYSRFARRKCDQDLVICANNAFTHAYVRDRSEGEHWEVSTGIVNALGVPHGTFSGAIYGDENDPDFLRDSRCRSPPSEQEQQPIEVAQSEEADGEEMEITDASTSSHSITFRGLCIRTPFGPGQVRFNSCTAAQLNDYAVIPETGTALTMPPANGVWYDSDGFWQRHHRPKSEWFKVGNHCDMDVTCAGDSFNTLVCCNLAASVFRGIPRWVSTPHSTSNPF
ncbi:MAG: hypothetical protein C4B59_12580 [Candidatus Methanogaster sp.]|uniref:Uncharacterized protein n=1 Tax=Candidatus Methanogaster sp. TaxID=3386292 RepID=A0AC61L0G5_9EURY|nr:MAG: hypothetical protein C4B59_12580 [ANME-2 cluster archaeon]